MAMRIQCTQCESSLNVSEDLKGKTIRCPKCKELTRVPGGSARQTIMPPAKPGKSAERKSVLRDDDDDAPRSTKPSAAARPGNGKVPKKTMLARPDAESEGIVDRKKTPSIPVPRKPKKTQLARDPEDDDDDRPVRKAPPRRRDDDDDFDDAPPPRRKGRSNEKPARSPMIWIGAGVGGLVLIGGIVVTIMLLNRAPAEQKQLAANPAPMAMAPPNPDPSKQPNPMTPPKDKGDPLVKNDPEPKQKDPETKQPIQIDPGPKEAVPQATPIPPGQAPTDIEPTTTKKVKKATVYLKVKAGGGESWEGSGFFGVESGIVFTNAHVVGMLSTTAAAPKEIEVVVHSGQKEEFKLTGTVLGVDRENDLAVVRVTGDLARCPPPLPVELMETSLTELQKVYIFGFPHGASLGKEITASSSSVSSFRRDVDGSLFQIQVNGGMHPGNSGGPVVDSRGVVVGIAVAGIKGTQINFAVPSEKIQGMLHGRVQEANLGAPYRDNQAVKLPLKLTCLDPLQRIREVSLDVWSGPTGSVRPASFKAPATLVGDGAKQSVPLKYALGNASHDLLLPSANLPAGHAYWIQPVVVTTSGVKHWASATPFEPASSPPLERVPVNLTFKTTPSQRTVNLKSKFEIKVKDKVVDADYVTAEMLEMMEARPPQEINIRLAVGKGEFTMHNGVKLIKRNAQAQNFALRRLYGFDSDLNGKLVRFTFPNFKIKDFIVQMETEEMSGLLNSSYQAVCLSVPNRQVAPLETWPTKITLIVGAGKKKTPLDLVMTCSYEGSRQVDGKKQAMLRLTGQLETRKPTVAGRPTDRITGHALFDVDGGYFTKVNISLRAEGDAQGILYTRIMEFDVGRVPGNVNNIPVPAANPPPTDQPVAKVIFQQQGALQVTDPPNPKKPGSKQKVFSVNLNAGKSYVIDLKAAPGSPLDPYLRLEDATGNVLAEDDDGGGFPNAKITFKAQKNGPHRLVVTHFTDKLGAFQLIVTEVGAAPGIVNNNPDPKEGAPPKGWTVLFKSDDPALWNTESPGDQFAVPVRTAHSTIRFLRLKRMDTGEALIIPITHQQLARQPAAVAKEAAGWNGSASVSFGGRHLGIYQQPAVQNFPREEICVMSANVFAHFHGSGFGHKAYVHDRQYHCWKGKELAKTVFEIAVTTELLTAAEKGMLMAAANDPDPNEGPAPAGWTVLFKSDDPARWNTDSPGDQFAVPVRTAHSTVRFLRLKRMDTGEALIIPITHQQLAAQPSPYPTQGHAWNGAANLIYGGRHLGILKSPSLFPPPKAEIMVACDGPFNNFRGSGFGHKAHVDDAQYYSWNGNEISKTIFEIAVTADPLTEAEKGLLLMAGNPGQLTAGNKGVPMAGNAGEATSILGGAFNPQFKDEAPANGLLVGFEFGLGKWINNDNIKAIRPIYSVAKYDEVEGKQYGNQLKRVVTVKAKAGYAVGSITVNAGMWIDCVIVTFMRIADGKLDPSDSYLSDPVGSRGVNPIMLGGDGSLVIGIVGKANQNECGGIGLLLKK